MRASLAHCPVTEDGFAHGSKHDQLRAAASPPWFGSDTGHATCSPWRRLSLKFQHSYTESLHIFWRLNLTAPPVLSSWYVVVCYRNLLIALFHNCNSEYTSETTGLSSFWENGFQICQSRPQPGMVTHGLWDGKGNIILWADPVTILTYAPSPCWAVRYK